MWRLVLALGGCGLRGGDSGCADCGPCGILGGPEPADGLVLSAGPDVDDAPTVELGFVPAGACGSQWTSALRLVWQPDATVAFADDWVPLTPCAWQTTVEGYLCRVGSVSIVEDGDGEGGFAVSFEGDGVVRAFDCVPGDGTPECRATEDFPPPGLAR